MRRGVVRDGVSVDLRLCAGTAGSGRAGCGGPRRRRDRKGQAGRRARRWARWRRVPAGTGPPPQNFTTSTEHYQFLLRLHKGGTRHTYESVPKWEGLWSAAGNTSTTLFVKGGGGPAYRRSSPGCSRRRTKPRSRCAAPWAPTTTGSRRCEPAGYPRWLLEPYVREFVNTPTQSWWPNDLANDTRRIYINQEHKNIDGTHSPEGDSIGFWVDDMLIVHTIHIHPSDYFRGQPPTSNQFESVEVWRMIPLANGERRLSVNVTFYDRSRWCGR